jgi:hypothetical protein
MKNDGIAAIRPARKRAENKGKRPHANYAQIGKITWSHLQRTECKSYSLNWASDRNRFLTLLSNMLTNINLTDMEVCYKVFRREIINQVKIQEDRFGFEPEITAKVAKLNYRIYEVGISYFGRSYEEGKKIGWKDGVQALWCVLKYNLLSKNYDVKRNA